MTKRTSKGIRIGILLAVVLVTTVGAVLLEGCGQCSLNDRSALIYFDEPSAFEHFKIPQDFSADRELRESYTRGYIKGTENAFAIYPSPDSNLSNYVPSDIGPLAVDGFQKQVIQAYERGVRDGQNNTLSAIDKATGRNLYGEVNGTGPVDDNTSR